MIVFQAMQCLWYTIRKQEQEGARGSTEELDQPINQC